MKGATCGDCGDQVEQIVSIHAPNEGSDLHALRCSLRNNVSIHAPNEGSDHEVYNPQLLRQVFQSTLPMKGAT